MIRRPDNAWRRRLRPTLVALVLAWAAEGAFAQTAPEPATGQPQPKVTVAFDLTWSKPRPLVARRHRLEVRESIAADGTVVEPLDETGVREAARELEAAGIEAVAIFFINSYRNPAHEQRAAEIVRAACPELPVCTSHAVLPEMKE